MDSLVNPFRHKGLPRQDGLAQGRVVADPSRAQALFKRCPAAAATPLRDVPVLAQALGIAELHLKDESQRMGLGSFKALGAAYVIARAAADKAGPDASTADMACALQGRVFACASAGNHGLSMAAGARLFGATAVIYLSKTVPQAFAQRLRDMGADVVRAGEHYEASMAAAARDSEENGWTLLSDSSWPGYTDLSTQVMEGYLVMAGEVADSMNTLPTHVFLQAGVGGFAAAMAALFRTRWGDAPVIVVVEPDTAAALIGSVRAGKPVAASGPSSTMGRLDCKEPSHLALGELAREADHFMTITDDECSATVAWLAAQGMATTPSGAAGVAAVQHAGHARQALALTADSRVLAFITEGPEDTT